MTIADKKELRRFVADWAQSIDINQYRVSFEDLCEEVSYSLLDFIKEEHDFKFGDDMPYISEDQFWEFFKEWEKFEE